MSLELKTMLDYDLGQAADIMTRAFAGYQVRIEVDSARLSEMIVQDGIGIGDSRVVLRDGEVVAAALIARRGWSSRLAGMAVLPEARGQGIGGWLTEMLLAESKERGERRMELEVIASNAAAVRLYEKCGFRRIRRLVGFSAAGKAGPEGVASGEAGAGEVRAGEDGPGEPAAGEAHGGEAAAGNAAARDAVTGDLKVEEADIREVARKVTAYGLSNLPWQISGETLAKFGPPYVAYAMDGAYAVISSPRERSVTIRSVVVEPERRRRGRAARLLRALIAAHPAEEWRVPALCPEEMAPLFESLGFARGSLSQLHMVAEWG